MTIQLLPSPKEISVLDGTFVLSDETDIVIAAQAGESVFLAARQLRDEMCASGCPTPSILKAYRPPRQQHRILLVCGADQARAFGVEPLDLGAPESVAAQAYGLIVKPEGACLYAPSETGVFYAVQTLRQWLRLHGPNLPSVLVKDWPTLAYRGLMLDVSRGKVPTVETLKHVVETLSHYKLNVLQLYTEHTFKFPSHPMIGAESDSLTSEDIVELDEFCRRYRVELMPNLQSFGHAYNTLILPEYRHLAETELLWTLRPDSEETYELLDDLYADMLPCFSSTVLNVNCDETWDLGKGATRELAEEIGVGRVYLNHILRVRELAARYGRTVQLWGDILLHHPELIDELPDDVTLMDWHYDPADTYPSVEIFGRSGRRFWVCPGTGSWNSIFPRLYGATVNIRNLVRDGVASGAEGMLNTDWGDMGHYQPLGLSWHGYVFGAAQGWTGGATGNEDFDAAFGPLFFGRDHVQIMQAIHHLAHTNDLPNVPHSNRSHTILALFDEPLAGATVAGEDALPPETLTQMLALAENTTASLDRLSPGHPRELTLRETASAARLTAYAARKVALSQEIRRSLRDPDLEPERLYRYVMALRALDVELEGLRREFESLWLAQARPSEIHIALRYYAGLRIRYEAAIVWLEGQYQRLSRGEPVDAELSSYDPGDYRVLWQNWPG